MFIVDLQQGTDEWLEWRKPKVSASEIPIILGLCPYETVFELWAEKIGLLDRPDLSKNPNIRRGKAIEDTCRETVELEVDDVLLPLCGEYEHWPTLSASFDGVLNQRPYELKAPSKVVYDEIKLNGLHSATYKMYEAQVHAQCIVLGSTSGFLYFYHEGEELLEFIVRLDDSTKQTILDKAYEFSYRVENKLSPCPDASKDLFIPSDDATIEFMQSSVSSWIYTNRQIADYEQKISACKEEIDTYQSLLLTQMGSYTQFETPGLRVSVYETRGKIDYKQFVEDNFTISEIEDQLETYRKESRTSSRFTSPVKDRINPDVSFHAHDPNHKIPCFVPSAIPSTTPISVSALTRNTDTSEPFDGYF